MWNLIKLLAFILCLAMAFQIALPANSSIQANSELYHQYYFTVDNSSLSHQMAKSETVSHNFNQLPTFDLKNKPFSLQNLTTKKEILHKIKLTTYIDFSELIYYRLQPFTLIYPFNYFW